MSGDAIRRVTTILAAGALVAAVATITLYAPADAAKPKCGGKVATIVGTKKGEVIVGTAKADVIVARGGHDKIYGKGGNDTICAGLGNDLVVGGPGIDRMFGQPGRDRLYGGPGPDFLAGQLDDDTLVGGIGVDTCHQGPGTGPVVRCELPVLGPALIPLNGIYAVAYSDIDGLDGYSTGDVLISRIVEANGDGVLGVGDRVEMGRYPKTYSPAGPADFGDWGVKSHVVVRGQFLLPHGVAVTADPGQRVELRWWVANMVGPIQQYEEHGSGFETSSVYDGMYPGSGDFIAIQRYSPSAPGVVFGVPAVPNEGDAPFIDVEIYP